MALCEMFRSEMNIKYGLARYFNSTFQLDSEQHMPYSGGFTDNGHVFARNFVC
jgi:hypothetical protein